MDIEFLLRGDTLYACTANSVPRKGDRIDILGRRYRIKAVVWEPYLVERPCLMGGNPPPSRIIKASVILSTWFV